MLLENYENIPKLYETDNISIEDKIIYAKLFNPVGAGTWYVAEADLETGDCFGYADILCGEWGYFNLIELSALDVGFGLGIEEDIHFKPKRFEELNIN